MFRGKGIVCCVSIEVFIYSLKRHLLEQKHARLVSTCWCGITTLSITTLSVMSPNAYAESCLCWVSQLSPLCFKNKKKSIMLNVMPTCCLYASAISLYFLDIYEQKQHNARWQNHRQVKELYLVSLTVISNLCSREKKYVKFRSLQYRPEKPFPTRSGPMLLNFLRT